MGSTVMFHHGRPPQLLGHRIESDGHFSDMKLTTDGTRLFIIESNGVSVYRFSGPDDEQYFVAPPVAAEQGLFESAMDWLGIAC